MKNYVLIIMDFISYVSGGLGETISRPLLPVLPYSLET